MLQQLLFQGLGFPLLRNLLDRGGDGSGGVLFRAVGVEELTGKVDDGFPVPVENLFQYEIYRKHPQAGQPFAGLFP